MPPFPQPGVPATLLAAVLFGAGTPLTKLLLAALLYLGSGVGLFLLRQLRRSAPVRMPRGKWKWLAPAIDSQSAWN